MHNKKSVSTLIAVVLIIGMTIAGSAIVFQGYKMIINQQQAQANKQLMDMYCPKQFDFNLQACYIKATEEYGLIHIIIDNRYTAISSKSQIRLKGEGKTITLPIWDIGTVSAGGGADDDIKYTLAAFGEGNPTKIQLMPLFEDKLKKTSVLCENFPEFQIAECSDTSDRCNADFTRAGRCSTINPPMYCTQDLNLETRCTVGSRTEEGVEGKCPCPQDAPNCDVNSGYCY